MKVKLDSIVLDEDIYPRKNVSKKTIESYVEALKGGANFPPIEVQKVIVEENEKEIEKLICLDGWHRVLAYKEYNKQVESEKIREVDAFFWKSDALNKKEFLEELRVESARRNLTHGDRLGSEDLRFQLLRIVTERPVEKLNGIISELAETLGYDSSYISRLIGEEVRKRRMSRDAQILRISLLGWTQNEIAKLFGLDQSSIAKIMKNLTSQISNIQEQFYERHKPVEEIAEFYGLDSITVWAIVLQGKDDKERFSLFGRAEYQDDSPRIYNVWNFANCDPRLGEDHPGRIPGQIAMNVLYYYTKQGNLVVDPMAGGGSTIDACLVMGRKCRAYDVNPMRKDIVKWNLYDGFPKEAKNCDLIFLDPPYWNLQKGFYTAESISEVSLEEWINFMEKVIKESYGTVREGGHVALLVEAMVDERETKEFYDLPYMCMKFFEDAGFKEIHRISVPVTTQVKSHHDVEYAQRQRIILDVNRDLIIYRRS
jgi:transcriptional regulator with XRE-family HTH domain